MVLDNSLQNSFDILDLSFGRTVCLRIVASREGGRHTKAGKDVFPDVTDREGTAIGDNSFSVNVLRLCCYGKTRAAIAGIEELSALPGCVPPQHRELLLTELLRDLVNPGGASAAIAEANTFLHTFQTFLHESEDFTQYVACYDKMIIVTCEYSSQLLLSSVAIGK